MKLLLCTLNENKIKEITKALNKMPIDIITLFSLKDEQDIQETGNTLKENAFLKAKHYGEKHQVIALGDDTGLEVDYLFGAPGVHTKRYAESEALRNEKLIKELNGKTNRNAIFKTVICIYNPFKKEEYYFEGIVNGFITKEPKGSFGFGYDPIFFVKEKNKTMAELTLEEKNEISHRGKALKLLQEFLYENINNI